MRRGGWGENDYQQGCVLGGGGGEEGRWGEKMTINRDVYGGRGGGERK